jgi:hypothetical protein
MVSISMGEPPSSCCDLAFADAHTAERAANAAHRLTGSMLVFDQRESDVLVAELAEPDPGRDRHLRFAQQHLRELDRAERAKLLGDAGPHEHRRLRPLDRPAGARQAVAQHVAAALIGAADVGHALLRPVERVNRRHLDRCEDAVVGVALEARQRAHHLAIPDREAHAPARHVVALGQREELDSDLLGALHLQEARRLVAIERQVRVSEVVDHQHACLAREPDDALEEWALDDGRGRIVGERKRQQFRLRPALSHCALKTREQLVDRQHRRRPQVRTGDDRRIGVDGVGRTGTDDHVPGAE